ncbi:hypothetical protein QTP88_000818 [Uroleucon formosanum]
MRKLVATHLNALDSSSKLFGSNQLRYNGNSVSASLNSNETTTNIVEKVNLNNYYRENESSPASSHGTEQNSLELNISESSDGSKNLSNKLEHDINNDIQSTSLSIASLDAFENWKGQGKSDVPKLVIKNKDVPKKRLTTYMDPTPEIDRILMQHLFIETDVYASNNLFGLEEFPTKLNINDKEFILYGIVAYYSNHYVAHLRRSENTWETHNDLVKKIKTNTQNDIQRFFHLRSCLKGEAAQVIRYIETTAANYNIAWNSVEARYNNKKVLVQSHTKELFDIPAINEEAVQLRKLIDQLNGHMSALEALGEKPKEWGSILLHLIATKLDSSTLKAWETVSPKNEIPKVQVLLEFLEKRFKIMEAVETSSNINIRNDEKIKNNMINESFEDETDDYRIEFEELYFSAMALGENILQRLSTKKDNGDQKSVSIGHNTTHAINCSANSCCSGATAEIKLSPIDIPKFSGAYEEWSAFHDIYIAMVHNNARIDDIQRFFHLRSCLKGEAAQVIRYIETTAANYNIAWNSVEARYNNKKVLVQSHTKELFDIPAINEEAVQLRKLIDQLNGHMSALEALGEKPKEWGSILLHLIATKLDSSTLKAWETVYNISLLT